MKYLIVLLLLVSSFCSYMTIRTALWANMVIAPYMSAKYEQDRCDKYWRIVSSNQIKRKLNLPQEGTCPFDNKACDKYPKMWDDYEKSKKDYDNHKWLDEIKKLVGVLK